jgi:hypothetical protein
LTLKIDLKHAIDASKEIQSKLRFLSRFTADQYGLARLGTVDQYGLALIGARDI